MLDLWLAERRKEQEVTFLEACQSRPYRCKPSGNRSRKRREPFVYILDTPFDAARMSETRCDDSSAATWPALMKLPVRDGLHHRKVVDPAILARHHWQLIPSIDHQEARRFRETQVTQLQTGLEDDKEKLEDRPYIRPPQCQADAKCSSCQKWCSSRLGGLQVCFKKGKNQSLYRLSSSLLRVAKWAR